MNVPPDFNFEAFRMGKGGMGYPPPRLAYEVLKGNIKIIVWCAKYI